MRPYMYQAYQSSFNIEKYFIFLKTTHMLISCAVTTQLFCTFVLAYDMQKAAEGGHNQVVKL